MFTDVLMPAMGVTMEEGVVVYWLKKAGDWVEQDEALFEITTDKTNITIEAPKSGYLVEILVAEGETVPVGTVLAVLSDTKGEQAPANPEKPVRPISPRARKLAELHGITEAALNQIAGDGNQGRIEVADIEKYLANRLQATAGPEPSSTPTEAAPAERIALNYIQRLMGERMSQSNQEIPQVHLDVTVRAEEIHALREQLKFDNKKVSFNTFLIKACAMVFAKHPLANSSLQGKEIIRHPHVNTGIAVKTPQGLIAPVIHNCEQMSLLEIEAKFRQLVKWAMENQLPPEHLEDGTFTISNLGSYGIERFAAMVVPGQSCILAVGKLASRPWVDENKLIVCKLLPLTLTLDHRIMDGGDGAIILKELTDLLENPQRIR
jgi:pyruvate dehydrogenase E2 component (dihydrolipoamide acetyltransferase)